jgi:autotransporter-associated beta strand protein
MKLKHLKRPAAIIGCLLALAVPAAWGQVMSGSTPNAAYPTLQLWLRGDAGVTSGGDGTPVTSWVNQSTSAAAVGNADTSVIGSGNAPTYAASGLINGHPVVAFNGSSQGLDITNAGTMMVNGNYTMFVVLQSANTTWHALQVILANSYNTLGLYAVDPWTGTQYNDEILMQSGPPNYDTMLSAANISNTNSLLSVLSSGPLAGDTKMFIDGTESDSGVVMPAFNVSANWDLGWETGKTWYFNGQIAEILVYQGQLSAADTYKINQYLGAKYNVTIPEIPVTTPAFSPAPGTYPGPLSVTISSDLGATVFYTTNGTTPNNTSASGTSPLMVTVPANATSFTITAYSTNGNFLDSAAASATYSTESITPTWTSLGSGSWTNSANWQNGVVGYGPGVTANFDTLTLSGDEYVTMDGQYAIGNLVFGDVGNANNWFLDSGNNGLLTLNTATNMPVVTVADQTLTIGANSSSAVLSSANGLIKAGAGTLWIEGPAVAYTGPTVVDAGVLELHDVGTFSSTSITNNAGVTILADSSSFCGVVSLHGNGTWTVDGDGSGGPWQSDVAFGHNNFGNLSGDNTGTISETNYAELWIQMYSSGQPIGPTANFNVGPNANLNLWSQIPGYGVTVTIGGLNGSGTVDMPDSSEGGTNMNLAVGGGDATASFSGVIQNSASYSGGVTVLSLTKVGAGTETLTGANTYSGNTKVSSGTLDITQPYLAAGSTVSVASGAVLKLDFAGANTVSHLALNGVYQPPGTYSSATSSPYLAGTGSLQVLNGSIPAPVLNCSKSGNVLTFTWTGSYKLQCNTADVRVSPDWQDYPGGANSGVTVTINPATPTMFFRLSL